MNKSTQKAVERWRAAAIRASALWLILGSVLSVLLSHNDVWAALYFSVFALASLVDLWVLGKAIRAVFQLMSVVDTDSEKRTALAIQAFVWGFFKLACLGILGWILISLKQSPTASIVLGLGTLVVVSLLGGWIWSQRVVRHA